MSQGQDYRPRNSAMMEEQGADMTAIAQPPLETLAEKPPLLPPVCSEKRRPVPKPRNQRQRQYELQSPAPEPIPPAEPPHVIAPLPLGAEYPPPYSPIPGVAVDPRQQHFLAMQQPVVAPNPSPAPLPASTNATALPQKKKGFKWQIKPDYKFCTIWRGNLEIISRAALIVIGLFMLIISPIIIQIVDSNVYFEALLLIDADLLSSDPFGVGAIQALIRGTKSVSGFMIFLSIVCFITQIILIVTRFIFKGSELVLFMLHILDAIVCIIMAVLFLSGAAPAASYSSQWIAPPQLCQDAIIVALREGISGFATLNITCNQETLAGLLAGLAILGFVGLGVWVFLTTWTLYALKSKWDYSTCRCKEDEAKENNEENTISADEH